MTHNACSSGARTAQRFGRPAPKGRTAGTCYVPYFSRTNTRLVTEGETEHKREKRDLHRQVPFSSPLSEFFLVEESVKYADKLLPVS